MPFYYAHAYTHISYYQLVVLFDSDPCYFSPDSSIFFYFLSCKFLLCVLYSVFALHHCACAVMIYAALSVVKNDADDDAGMWHEI